MTTNEIQIEAESRSEFGKGAARRIRRADKVPAVIYGHGAEPQHVSLPGHATLLALRTANALLAISIDGGEVQLALPKQVQRDPIKGFLEHVDLVVVKRGERVTVEVPLHIIGADTLADATVVADQLTIQIECLATNIPAQVDIDVTGLAAGAQVVASDLTLPEGAVFPGDPDDLILSITAQQSEEDYEAALAGGEEAAPAAEAEAAEDAE